MKPSFNVFSHFQELEGEKSDWKGKIWAACLWTGRCKHQIQNPECCQRPELERRSAESSVWFTVITDRLDIDYWIEESFIVIQCLCATFIDCNSLLLDDLNKLLLIWLWKQKSLGAQSSKKNTKMNKCVKQRWASTLTLPWRPIAMPAVVMVAMVASAAAATGVVLATVAQVPFWMVSGCTR